MGENAPVSVTHSAEDVAQHREKNLGMPDERQTDALEQMLVRISNSALREAVRFVVTHLDEHGVVYGCADLFCLGADEERVLLAASAAHLALARGADSRPVFSKVLVFARRREMERVGALILAVFGAVAPGEGDDALRRVISKRIEIRSIESLDAGALMAAVKHAPARSACVVEAAADYRHAGVLTGNYEEEWTRHLVRSVSALHETAVDKSLYIAALAGRFRPRLEENRQTLMAIEGALITEMPSDTAAPEELLESWLVHAKVDLAGALASVVNSSLTEDDKVVAGVLCRHAAGEPGACAALRPVLERFLASAPPENITVLARLAATDLPFAALVLEKAPAVRQELAGHSALVSLGVSVLEERLRRLAGPLREDAAEFSDLVRALRFLTRYLGEHPQDAGTRVRLTNALSTEASGLNGVVLLVWCVLHLGESVTILPQPDGGSARVATLDEFTRFHTEFWKQREATGAKAFPLVPEPLAIPLDSVEAEALLQQGVHVVEHMAWRLVGDEPDSRALLMVLKTCIDLASAAGSRIDGLEILRLAADGIADSGGNQLARNLAEQALSSRQSDASPTARWFAWVTFSDVYHRVHNPLEAIAALLCAYSQPGIEAPPRLAFPAVTLAARILRDIGFHDAALEFSERARALLQRAHLWEQNRHQVEGLEASISFKRLLRRRAGEDEWRRLGEDLSAIVERALERLENVGVPALMLAQVLRIFEAEKWPASPRANKAFQEAVAAVGEPVASRLVAHRAVVPGLKDVRAALWGSLEPRYARDMGEDLHKAALMAPRVLSDASQRGRIAEALASIELLLDHSIGVPEDAGGHGAAPLTLSEALQAPDRLTEAIKRISERGVGVHALALREDGRLVRVSACEGGSVEVVAVSPDTFSDEAVERWHSEVGPSWGNAKSDVSLNSVERKMQGIGIGCNGRRSGHVFVRGPRVGDLPANLLLADGVLLGTVAPVTSAPSLSWLSAEVARDATVPPSRRAWLLPGSDGGALGVLNELLLQQLPPRGFELLGANAPGDMRRSGVAVVAGHGSVWHEQRFFRVVSGEDKSIVTPNELADAVAGSAVVVLLVCSGGKVEHDFFSLRRIGLPHLLLGRGCRSVVASPWPIDAAMAGRWLEAFLDAVEEGFTVAESTFHANGELQRSSLRVPDFLAMHVYGNPFLTAKRIS
ncbi:MAG: CHAT domain-containing protein [Anaeromyxobacteraceae bacterium]